MKFPSLFGRRRGTPREHYTMGYDAVAVGMMAKRTAASHAAFLLPHLAPGQRVLDCGCGPGAITVGLADLVVPGHVTGFEVEPTQVEMARARVEGRTNLTFETGSIYELPVDDASVDRVHVGAVLMNVREPLRALREIHRVLKPGGAIGAREGDQGGDLIAPDDLVVRKGMALYTKLRQHNGHDPFLGRRLRGLLAEAGFTRITAAATYESHGTPEAARELADLWRGMITKSNIATQLLELGWANQFALNLMASRCDTFAAKPDAFAAYAWCEAIGWKAAAEETSA
jgi:ubiquinone/menaquinone biosynthesis C-methylase UbiE